MDPATIDKTNSLLIQIKKEGKAPVLFLEWITENQTDIMKSENTNNAFKFWLNVSRNQMLNLCNYINNKA